MLQIYLKQLVGQISVRVCCTSVTTPSEMKKVMFRVAQGATLCSYAATRHILTQEMLAYAAST